MCIKKTKRNIYKHRTFVILFAATFIVQGCGSNSTSAQPDAKVNSSPHAKQTEEKVISLSSDPQLAKCQRLWSLKAIKNYRMTASMYAGGTVAWANPVSIEVLDGRTVSIKHAGKDARGRTEGYRDVDTIDKMFAVIQSGIEKGATVRYNCDDKLGFPSEWYIDFTEKGSDQYRRMVVKNFEIL